MTHPLLRRAAAIALLCFTTGTLASSAHAADNNRKDWYKEFDYNGDKRLKGKEVRHFKKDHEAAWTKLREWCEEAKEKPNKYDVNFPKDVKEKKFKCKKYRVDEPYIKAWIRAAGTNDERREGNDDRYDEDEKARQNEATR